MQIEPVAATPMMPAPADALDQQYYQSVLSFVIANAWQGEVYAVENYSMMAPMFDDVDAKIEVVHQAKDEAKHILVLEKLARRLGFEVDRSMVADGWPQIRKHFNEAVQRKDLAACLIIQDLMVEAMAVGLYGTFAGADNKDETTAGIAKNLLADEVHHLDIGINRIKGLMEKDRDAVHDSLLWAHTRVMPHLFSMVHTACEFLCDRKNIPCFANKAFVENGVLHLEGERQTTSYLDLDSLKIASLEHYVDMLHRAEFDTDITNQLIASMQAYEVPGKSTGVKEALARRS